jgi:hypothetical protein
MRRPKKSTRLRASAKPAQAAANGTPVIEKIASRRALEALEQALAAAQGHGPFPLGAAAGMAAHSKAAANDAVAMAERIQRHFSAIDAPSRRS